MSPEPVDVKQATIALLEAIRSKAPVRVLEFGFDEDDELKWWAKATLRSGRVRTAEVTVEDPQLGAVEVLGEIARECGLSVRIGFKYTDEIEDATGQGRR